MAANKLKNRKILNEWIAIILIILNKSSEKKNSDTEISGEDFSSRDDCRCFERELLKCNNESWTLDEDSRICRNGNKITNVLLGCSKYECSGKVYSFNFENKTWEIKN